MFFFITFINTVRWCNYRTKPKRETRGVSRSKCADLITACVPVSWAMAIIITESVDAADYCRLARSGAAPCTGGVRARGIDKPQMPLPERAVRSAANECQSAAALTAMHIL